MIVDLKQTATIIQGNADYTSSPIFESSKKYDFENIHFFQGQACKFILKYPIPCFFYFDEDSLIGECPNLGLISAGESRQDIRNYFDVEFEFLYETYFKEKDKNLTTDAKQLKKAISSLLKNVEKD